MKTTTQQDKLSFMRPAMVACGLVLGLVSAQGVAQQTVSKAAPAVQAGTATSQSVSLPASAPLDTLMPGIPHEEPAPTPKDPGKEGIHVHGHWVIDVKNPDGTVVEHRDFENALTTGAGAGTTDAATGDQLLVALLSGTVVPSDPGIGFIQAAGGAAALGSLDPTSLCLAPALIQAVEGAPVNPAPSGVTCYGFATTQSVLNIFASHTPNFSLTTGLGVTANFAPTTNWVLSGNYAVPAGLTSVTAVQTLLPVCDTKGAVLESTASGPLSMGFIGSTTDSTVQGSASNCTAASALAAGTGFQVFTFGPLTYYVLPTALGVTPGQVLTVTVTISFS